MIGWSWLPTYAQTANIESMTINQNLILNQYLIQVELFITVVQMQPVFMQLIIFVQRTGGRVV